MILKILERWTTFSIATSPFSEWIGSKNSGKPLWVETKEYLNENSWGLEFDETWPTTSFVHLIEKKNKFPTNMGQQFEISSKVEFWLISQ
jgi:hypothetical protein